MESAVGNIAELFRRSRVATVYDVMDKMGYPDQCLDLGIKPLRPDMRIAGPAFTVRGSREPRVDEELSRPQFENFGLFRAMTPGCVVVINAEKDEATGHWGEMMSLTARQHGAVGAVVDGGTRDYAGIVTIPDWAVFARYTTPIESRTRWRPLELGAPIYVTGATKRYVLVRPGDYIVGDADGVLVIPQEILPEVARRTEEVEKAEEGTRRDLMAGVPISEVFQRYRRM